MFTLTMTKAETKIYDNDDDWPGQKTLVDNLMARARMIAANEQTNVEVVTIDGIVVFTVGYD